jgi:hypothetical protein
MDGLGHFWELRGEMPDPHEYAFADPAVWLKQLAQVKTLQLDRRPERLSPPSETDI